MSEPSEPPSGRLIRKKNAPNPFAEVPTLEAKRKRFADHPHDADTLEGPPQGRTPLPRAPHEDPAPPVAPPDDPTPTPTPGAVFRSETPTRIDPRAETRELTSADSQEELEEFWDLLHDTPDRLGAYQIQGEIARGGMGIVLRGYHAQLDRAVAIKVLRSDADGNPRAEHRFLREARACAKLRHANIVAVHDVGIDDEGRSFLVMDLVEGGSMKDLLEERGPLPPLEAAELMEKVTRGVAHAHAQGILHRDLKPHNVLIDAASGEPLLTDFGLAKQVYDESASSHSRDQRQRAAHALTQDLTRSDDILGTPRYMAPEQIDTRLGRVNQQSDVYALGVLLYQCVTGDVPFRGRHLEELFVKVLEGKPTPPSARVSEVPHQLEAIILRCLEKEQRLRYRSALELANDLHRFRNARPVLSVTHRAPAPPPGRPWASILAALGLGALAWAFATGVLDPGALRPDPAPTTLATPEPSPEVATSLSAPSPDVAGGVVALDLRLSPEALTTANIHELAGKGYLDAQYTLGYAILDGQVEGELSEALSWLDQAAQGGYAKAQLLLGQIHAEGRYGQPVDGERAAEWYRLGDEAGVLEATVRLGGLLLEDERTRPEAIERLRAIADRDVRALELLGIAHAKSERFEEAVAAWQRGAEAGSALAARLLGQAYATARGVERDHALALQWLERAADQDEPGALVQLGLIYELGSMGQVQDRDLARHYYERAVALGSAEAQVRLDTLR